MSKKKPYYAVSRGREIGIFETYEECEKSVKGFPNNEHQSFETAAAAKSWLEAKLRERGIEPPKKYKVIIFPTF